MEFPSQTVSEAVSHMNLHVVIKSTHDSVYREDSSEVTAMPKARGCAFKCMQAIVNVYNYLVQLEKCSTGCGCL